MQYDQRKAIIDWLAEAELKYPVATWSHGGVSFWPMLKVVVFFIVLRASKSSPKRPIYQRVWNKVVSKLRTNVLGGYYHYRRTKIQAATVVFSGAYTHRTTSQGKFLNRYFDPIMDYLASAHQANSLLVEYRPIDVARTYAPSRVMDATRMLPYFAWKNGRQPDVPLACGDAFDQFLVDVEARWGIRPALLRSRLLALLRSVGVWKAFWVHCLSAAQPRLAFGLCYYNAAMYGLNLAGHELGIPVVDMQHGGQGSLHPSYNYFRLPKVGYALLPHVFWCWDEASASVIRAFAQQHPVHSVVVGGNPWIDEIRTAMPQAGAFSDYSSGKKVILFTLQTTSTPILDDYILAAIAATPEEYIWWLRLHPRMTSTEIAELNRVVSDRHMAHKIDIATASALPLPYILAHCFAHLSKSSGSIGEAALLRTPVNVILNAVGATTYAKLVEQGAAVYYEHDGSEEGLWAFLCAEARLTDRPKLVSSNNIPNFKTTIDELLEK